MRERIRHLRGRHLRTLRPSALLAALSLAPVRRGRASHLRPLRPRNSRGATAGALIGLVLALACAEPEQSAARVLLRTRIEERLGQRTRVAHVSDSALVLVVQAARRSAVDTALLRRTAAIAALVASANWPGDSLRRVSVIFERPVRIGPFTVRRRRVRFDMPAGSGALTELPSSAPVIPGPSAIAGDSANAGAPE